MWDSESYSSRGRDYANEVLRMSKNSIKADAFYFEQRDQCWYVSSDTPSDCLVQIGGVGFHLHKYPLISRSGKMTRLINESQESKSIIILLDELPGGSEAFELAAKFCYSIPIGLTAAVICGLRCAADYLEMTEEFEEGNLIFKTESFLSYVVLSAWKDSILVLKSCENLSSWAENLQIVRRCSESIAWKACVNPKTIKWQYTGKCNEITEVSPSTNQQAPQDWWFEDVSVLRIDHFVRVITAIKVKGMKFDLVGASIMHYAEKWLPGFVKGTSDEATSTTRGSGSGSGSGSSSWRGGFHMIVAGTKASNQDQSTTMGKDQRMIIESLVSIIPPQKDSVSCSFLLRLLRMANVLKISQALINELEKRVGMQLEEATLTDLLMPSYGKSETLFDVDLVQRSLEHFLVQEQTECSSPIRNFAEESQRGNNLNALMKVARLIDSYLADISRDRSLTPTKFQVLAEALPDSARICDDGLYRAIDSYLKAHSTLSEHEKKRLCRIMDCQKLSLEACMHAAQNERLPLRIVVQVLFSEQMKITKALANSTFKEANGLQLQPPISTRKTLLEGTPQSFQEGWAAAIKDISTLKFEIESVKGKHLELQENMESLEREFDKVVKPKQTSAWFSGWKKLSKIAKMTNLDSNESGCQNVNEEQSKRKARKWRDSIS